ncbi:hypothetical protein [Agrococcus jenensis]|uniref:Host cell surface-exposed lipoprotein n=1 Tax=Agrococcus jenensis TaxID=46353 RepID=A0A3N2AV03_9MICO|nr:hypothetical protein [Agrococcus jenensis]ROR66785.1 hypothetical protein EDD26_2180 [Agrococcus jenensis]
MRRILASLTVAAAMAAALTGCVIAPPGLDSGWVSYDGSYGPADDPAYDEFDAEAEEQWQEENREWQLDFAEEVAEELRAAGSQLPPAEGESLEQFRHLVVGVGYEWCDRLYVDESLEGDAVEHGEMADRYGWSPEEYRILAEEAELALCAY